MPLKVSSWGAYKKNLSQFGPGVWAVGGGAIDFGPTTSYNSGTSVVDQTCSRAWKYESNGGRIEGVSAILAEKNYESGSKLPNNDKPEVTPRKRAMKTQISTP